jgi:hypothetical protein
MNCRAFESVVVSIARTQLMDVTTREQALSHTEVCVLCSNRLAEERALFEGVRSVVAELAKLEAPTCVEASLLAAFREQAAQPRRPNVVALPTRTSQRRIRRLAAAAAILILISGLSLFWSTSSAPPVREEVVVPAEPTISDSLPPEGKAVISVSKPPGRQPVRKRRQELRSPSSEVEVEVATEFFPLIEGHDIDSLETGQIVRIELPGSALAAIGLAGGGESSSEPVEAEVVLGHDGLARAIRFVR